MMNRRERNLDMMARMADDWRETTDHMVQIAVGMVLQMLEVTSVTIKLSDVGRFARDYDLTREFHDADGEPCMTFRLTEKPHDPEVPTQPT